MSDVSINNNLLIEQFKLLSKYVQQEIDNNTDLKSTYIYKLKQIKFVINILKKYPKTITIDNVNDLLQIKGIGQHTINRLKDILIHGELLELKDFNDKLNDIDENVVSELESVVGIGRHIALNFIKMGIKSVDDLKTKVLSNELYVNKKIKLGLKYYQKFFGNIPRKEIKEIKYLLYNVLSNINKKLSLTNDNKYIIKICGSYRRKKIYCNDIDVLISKKNTTTIDSNIHLHQFIDLLKVPLKLNNNKPFIIDDITDKKYKTKYMGFCKYKHNLCRRIDIRYVAWKHFYPALLYFTGSASHNQKLRRLAKQKKYKLSEYGLYDINTKQYKDITSEKDIFRYLNLNYVSPKLRE